MAKVNDTFREVGRLVGEAAESLVFPGCPGFLSDEGKISRNCEIVREKRPLDTESRGFHIHFFFSSLQDQRSALRKEAIFSSTSWSGD